MKQSLYSCTAVETLIRHYIDHNGDVLTIDEGCLGYGLTILIRDYFGFSYKEALIYYERNRHNRRLIDSIHAALSNDAYKAFYND